MQKLTKLEMKTQKLIWKEWLPFPGSVVCTCDPRSATSYPLRQRKVQLFLPPLTQFSCFSTSVIISLRFLFRVFASCIFGASQNQVMFTVRIQVFPFASQFPSFPIFLHAQTTWSLYLCLFFQFFHWRRRWG